MLVSFDCRRYEAELAAARAGEKEAQLALENSQYLNARQAAGRLDVEVARARLERASAEAQALEARRSQCTLLAPYDGRVAALAIEEHEIPVAGQPMLTILDTGDPEIELIVPSHWLAWLAIGRTFRFRIDETGSEEAASVVRIGAAVDPVSQSVTITGRFAAPAAGVIAGMSGSATFDVEGQ